MDLEYSSIVAIKSILGFFQRTRPKKLIKETSNISVIKFQIYDPRLAKDETSLVLMINKLTSRCIYEKILLGRKLLNDTIQALLRRLP